MVTVLISKQSFFQHCVWPVQQGKSYLHGIALRRFYIVISFFHKKSKQARVPTFVWLFRDNATTAKGPGYDEGTNLRLRDFAAVPLMPTRVPCLLGRDPCTFIHIAVSLGSSQRLDLLARRRFW